MMLIEIFTTGHIVKIAAAAASSNNNNNNNNNTGYWFGVNLCELVQPELTL